MIVNLSAKPIRKATKSPQVTISPYPTKQSKPNQASADISHGSSAKPSICTVDKEMYTNQATAFTCE